jgi:hypothetical protein
MSNPNPETVGSENLDKSVSDRELEAITDEFIEQTSTHKEVIETVISSLEQNNSAMVVQTEGGYLWKFQYGSVEVFVQLTGESDEDLLTVWSPVLKLPAKDETGLMRKLLEMNWSETFETRFGITNNQIIVLSQRTVADLSPEEISRAITLVATIADDNDEILKETYGAT